MLVALVSTVFVAVLTVGGSRDDAPQVAVQEPVSAATTDSLVVSSLGAIATAEMSTTEMQTVQPHLVKDVGAIGFDVVSDKIAATATTLPPPIELENAPDGVETEKPNNVVATPVVPVPTPPAGFDIRPPTVGPGGLALTADAPDPAVLHENGYYYFFTTNTRAGNVPIWVSTDLNHWFMAGDSMPNLPSWAVAGTNRTWAPSVNKIGGTYVMYFTAHHRTSDLQCIGVATSARVGGPYQASESTLVCPVLLGGAIDPELFRHSNGSLWLIYKNDGNCCRVRTSIWSAPLAADGRSIAGASNELLYAAASWEGGLIEGATLIERSGRFHLFYSGNWWLSATYAIGHAVCDGVDGPCYRSSTTPFMGNRPGARGLGGPSMWVSGSNEVWMTYHAWTGPVGYPQGRRAGFLHRIDFPDWQPPPTTTIAPTTTAAPPTTAPTTAPPTTVPPTTVPLTTVPPTTVPPTSVPPTSVPPTTAPPTSVPPTSAPPTTAPPTTAPPTTAPPTTVPPTSAPPTTAAGTSPSSTPN